MRTQAYEAARPSQEERDRQEQSLYEWLHQCIMKRKSLSFSMAHALYNHIRNTREIIVVDFRAQSNGIPLRHQDGKDVDEDEPVISLVSMPYPHISLSAHDSVGEAVEVAHVLGLSPRICIYPTTTFKH